MTPEQKLEMLKEQIDFLIMNQEDLKEEYKEIGFPQWNVGYLECLLNIRNYLK
jgi:hypothetical protein